MPRDIPVLLYHAVADKTATGQDQWAVPRSLFAEHVDVLRTRTRNSLTAAALGEILSGHKELPERPVGVTFDDGYEDVIEAVSHLADTGILSTIYVTTSWVGRRGMVSWNALGDLHGVEVGSHSHTHSRLDEIADTALGAEVRGSRERVEDGLGAPCLSFSYPHGNFSARVREQVIAAGYTSAAAVKNALSHTADDPFAFARVTVTRSMSAERLAAALDSPALPSAWAGERLRTKSYRSYRRGRRAIGRPVRRFAPWPE